QEEEQVQPGEPPVDPDDPAEDAVVAQPVGADHQEADDVAEIAGPQAQERADQVGAGRTGGQVRDVEGQAEEGHRPGEDAVPEGQQARPPLVRTTVVLPRNDQACLPTQRPARRLARSPGAKDSTGRRARGDLSDDPRAALRPLARLPFTLETSSLCADL